MRQRGAYSGLRISGKTGPHSLPLARIKKIMKNSSDEVKMISGEAPIVFSKACELFIEELTKRAWMTTVQAKKRTLHKEDVASAVINTDIFDFLVNLVSENSGKSSEDPQPGLGIVASTTEVNDLYFYSSSIVIVRERVSEDRLSAIFNVIATDKKVIPWLQIAQEALQINE
ncbi:nuclear transcription factor Y subunit C-4-like [Olea europaea var. sylvestris]|uniref:nuclear transcription factor Y subunit C-4-like n=1 Tax=Olea europaea var. sylvestris TaxID=158386 RepID=UPI000C1D07AE|nr:nuclear transcription factor Y subunit C-4-like [Olea europaea var. sylvestris]